MSLIRNIPRNFAGPSLLVFDGVALFVSSASTCRAQDSGSNYRLSPNDLIEIRVFQEPDLDSRVRIGGDGSVTLPLVGTVALGGKTVNEASDFLRRKYGERFLVNPQLTVTVTDYSKKRFTVLGQVQSPGSYSMPDNEDVTLLQAIGMAGGYTRLAEPANVTVKRIENGAESLMKLNAKRMARGGTSAAFKIRPGDVISVPESMF
jgi:polysaccharide export outer membrane protein